MRNKEVLLLIFGSIVLSVALVAIGLALSRHLNVPQEVLLTGLGIAMGFWYFFLKFKLEKASYFRESFRLFNCRYDALNDRLNSLRERLSSKDSGVLTSEDKRLLDDYFNLCAEEYLEHTNDLVPKEVWRCWENGMREFWKIRQIADYWDSESRSNSYYSFCPNKVLGIQSQLSSKSFEEAA